MNLPTLTLNPQLEASLASGHPWVYHNHLPDHDLETGEWVRVQAGRAWSYGLFDRRSPIALRLFGRDEPNAEMVAARVTRAL